MSIRFKAVIGAIAAGLILSGAAAGEVLLFNYSQTSGNNIPSASSVGADALVNVTGNAGTQSGNLNGVGYRMVHGDYWQDGFAVLGHPYYAVLEENVTVTLSGLSAWLATQGASSYEVTLHYAGANGQSAFIGTPSKIRVGGEAETITLVKSVSNSDYWSGDGATHTFSSDTLTITDSMNSYKAGISSIRLEAVIGGNPGNTPPVITEGERFAMNATKDGGAQTVVLHAVDANGNDLDWSISTPAAKGTATIDAENNTEATISYTPNAGYAGLDSFGVEVSNGQASTSITVDVSVVDPTADPVLTIVSPFGTSTPAAGTISYRSGTEVTVRIAGESSADTRHTPTGWTAVGSAPVSGTGSTVTFDITRDTVLTWNFLTEYRVDTESTSGGSVDVADGWYSDEIPLTITATPAQGYYFSGWTGDTGGALIGGDTLVLPMNRARGTITAQFKAEEVFSVIALPDTQNYSQSYPDIYNSQTQWIVDNIRKENIKFVTHLGDIVNTAGNAGQWKNANAAMDLLHENGDNTKAALVPYGTCPGNHDINDYYRQYYGENSGRWKNPVNGQYYDWYRGVSPTGWSDYQVITVNDRDWMFLHMDIDARDQDIAWAQAVLDDHPKALAVLTTHNYLAESKGSGSSGSGTSERGRVPVQWVSGSDRNNPNEVFEKLVYPNNQIYMVICGHNFAIYNLEETNAAGNVVHEVIVDYQTLPNGGNGFFRQMEYRPSEGKVVHSTYSPWLGRDWSSSLGADSQGMANLHDRYNGGFFDMLVDFDGRFDKTLTVISPQSAVTPSVGGHKIADGTPVVISAQDVVSGTRREHVSGWSLIGENGNTNGEGNVAVLTMDGNATLRWNYDTQYQLTTLTVGDGIVSTPSSWQDADAKVSITAQPDAGATFIRWSGDLSGATVNGSSISFTMDRARGPVTAEFSSASSTYSVAVNSPVNAVSPATGSYSYNANSEITFTASTYVSGGTRYVPIGYSYVLGDSSPVNGSGNSISLTLTDDLVFDWQWATQHSVNVSASGPGSVDLSKVWHDAGTPLSITAVADTHARFTGWSGDTTGAVEDGNQLLIDSLNAPFGTAVAEFTTDKYTLTVNSPFGTPVPAGPLTVAYGTVVDVSVDPVSAGRTRYIPTGWNTSGAVISSGAGNSGTVTVTGNIALTWNWETQVLLDIDSGAEGSVWPYNASQWYPLGSSVDLAAQPGNWFSFLKWAGDLPSGNDGSASNITVVMDQPRTLTVDFEPHLAAGGTPHWWFDVLGLATNGNYDAVENSDVDGNGLTVAQEFVFGIRTGARVMLDPSVSDGTFSLDWLGHIGRDYTVISGDDLTNDMQPSSQTISGQGTHIVFTTPKSGSRQFYRVSVELTPAGTNDSHQIAQSPGAVQLNFERDMVLIPAGSFTMGENVSGSASPLHTVNLKAFHMDRFEVTRGDWRKVVLWANDNGYDLPPDLEAGLQQHTPPDDHPVVPVKWYDAVKWCNARSEMEGLVPTYYIDTDGMQVYRSGDYDLTADNVNWSGNGYRLPTEAQWEYAARGGLEGMDFPWGNQAAEGRANTWQYLVSVGQQNDPYPVTRPVGYFNGNQDIASGTAADMANGYGLYDMAGNAYEWTWDWYSPYSALEEFDPKGPATAPEDPRRILRGGAWWHNSSDSRVLYRIPYLPDGEDPYGEVGFRCIRPAHPNE